MEDRIRCIKDVVMLDGRTCFTKGIVYKANLKGRYLQAENNDDEIHGLGERYDSFFTEHFVVMGKKKKRKVEAEEKTIKDISNKQLIERFEIMSVHKREQNLETLEKQFEEIKAEILRRMEND